MYYEFYQKRWSSKRLLGERLLLRVLPTRGGAQRGCLERDCYYEFYQEEVELEDCLEKQEDVIFEAIEMKKLQEVTKSDLCFRVGK